MLPGHCEYHSPIHTLTNTHSLPSLPSRSDPSLAPTRTAVVDGVPVPDGVTYVTIGDAGNREGHSSSYDYPAPAWSAFRDGTQFGHGVLTVLSGAALRWAWKRNVDGVAVATDVVYICNPLMSGGGPTQGQAEGDCWPAAAPTAPDAPAAGRPGKVVEVGRGRLSGHARVALLVVGLLCLSVAVLGLLFACLRVQGKRQAQAQVGDSEGGGEGEAPGEEEDDDGRGGSGGLRHMSAGDAHTAAGAGAGAGDWLSSWGASLARMVRRATGQARRRRGAGRVRLGAAESSHGLAMNASLHSEAADVI